MLRNYITIAIRHFWANKSYVIVNIIGLAVAISVCILAYFHLAYNFQFNEMYQSTTQNVYRIDCYGIMEGEKHELGRVRYPIVKSLMSETPEIKQRVRYVIGDLGVSQIKVKDKYYKDYITYTDSGFFQLFKHEFIYGNATALNDLSGIVLSDVDSKKYFGENNPLGQTVSIDYKGKKKTFVVRGVVKQPANNMFTFDAIARIETYLADAEFNENDWKYYMDPEVFVEILEKKNVTVVEKQLAKYVKIHNEFNPNLLIDYYKLVTFEDAGKRSDEIRYTYTYGIWRKSFVVMLVSIALLILLIACFNFTNTSIALAGTRIKEISLRKVMGSQRKHIIIQFLLEHFMISLLAVGLSFVISRFITPLYIGLYSSPEYGIWDFSSYDYIVPFLLVLLVFITLVSGAYPAFYLSKLKTSDALRRNLKLKGGNLFTYSLLTFQLIITVIGLGMGLVFIENINFIDKIDNGYAIESVISIPMDGSAGNRDFELFKSKIMDNKDIIEIAGSSQHISWWSWNEKTKYNDIEYDAIMLPTGENYLSTMGVKLKQGRFFDVNNYGDTNNVIINEKYLKTANVQDPLNQIITIYGRPFKIIGVVGDFLQRGTTVKVMPMVITFKNFNGIMAVKTTREKVASVNKYLEKKWIETFDMPYSGYPQLNTLDNDKWIHKLMKTIFLMVSAISLCLSLTGLFILISLIISKKTKEIGVRKIMGASILNIVAILSKKFIYIFAVAILVGSLCGLVITKGILDAIFKIDNHVEVTALPFLLSALLITVLSALTVGYKVYTAANANPVVSLKTD